MMLRKMCRLLFSEIVDMFVRIIERLLFQATVGGKRL